MWIVISDFRFQKFINVFERLFLFEQERNGMCCSLVRRHLFSESFCSLWIHCNYSIMTSKIQRIYLPTISKGGIPSLTHFKSVIMLKLIFLQFVSANKAKIMYFIGHCKDTDDTSQSAVAKSLETLNYKTWIIVSVIDLCFNIS